MRAHWFAAHAVYVYEAIRGRQTPITIVENVLLIRAQSAKAALSAALRLARRELKDDPSLTLDGKPARKRFLGVRKIVSCAADAFDKTSNDGLVREIRSGTEGTYLKYRVSGRAALRSLMAGREVDTSFEE